MIRVFTDGCFDCLHANHVRFLEKARAMGDCLVAGVMPDSEAAKYKRTPIMTEDERLVLVRAQRSVDEAFILPFTFETGVTEAFLREHRIDLVVYAGPGMSAFYADPIRMGIFHRMDYHDGISTSEIVRRIRARPDL